jgi:prophage regulatory protein
MEKDRFIREPECQELTGLSRTTRWRLERQGQFPARIQISPNAVAWRLSEIRDWQDHQAEVRQRGAET